LVERARRKSSRSREEQRRREKQRRQGEYRRQEVRKRRERIRRRKRKKRRMRFLVSLVCWLLVFTAALGGVYMLLPAMCVRAEVTVEAGSPCPGLEDLLRWESGTAELLSGLSEDMELDQVTDHEVVIRVYGREVTSTLHVEDTAAPEVVTKDLIIYAGKEVSAEDFIEEITDATATTVQFEQEPDCGTDGVHEVSLLVTDGGGNVTKKEASLEVTVDTEAPVISGVEDLTVPVGGSISYKKGITVTDNIDEEVELTVDASAVDLEKAGDYEVVYKAVDMAGNETTAAAVVHVEPVSVDNITEDLVNAEADKILASLFSDQSLSEYDKAKKIYNWCHERIAYFDGTPKTNWVQGAYRGLVERKGDCYVYAMTAKCLLTRAGIKNMDIEKIPTPTTMHYWNLIDIGEGWHHFDTCRRVDGSTFFYKTDAELMAYSNSHDGTHNYDRSRYPDIIP
jgi:hypothetical protein